MIKLNELIPRTHYFLTSPIGKEIASDGIVGESDLSEDTKVWVIYSGSVNPWVKPDIRKQTVQGRNNAVSGFCLAFDLYLI